jgi:hypothetical protein
MSPRPLKIEEVTGRCLDKSSQHGLLILQATLASKNVNAFDTSTIVDEGPDHKDPVCSKTSGLQLARGSGAIEGRKWTLETPRTLE